MKRISTALLAILLLALFILPASAEILPYGGSNNEGTQLGMTNDEQQYTEKNHIYDYRNYPGIGRENDPNGVNEKPYAEFEMKVNGTKVINSESGYDLDEKVPLQVVSPTDKVQFYDESSPSYNASTSKYNDLILRDVQCMVTPEGVSRDPSQLKEYKTQYGYSDLNGLQIESPDKELEDVEDIVQKAQKSGKTSYVEIYEAVSDVSDGGHEVWSVNGPFGEIKPWSADDGVSDTMKQAYPNGSTWYFATMVIKVDANEGPDFYPTPEGSTTWQESYATSAKTYTGKGGETLNIPVTLNDSGAKGTTDFSAVWYGHGADAAGGWSSPTWTAGKVELDQNGTKTFSVPVTVPQPGQETRLVFKSNVDGKTPANEANQKNNTMIINICPEGIDLAVTVRPAQTSYIIQEDQSVTPVVDILVTRKDAGTEPVPATLTIQSPNGKKAIDIVAPAGGTYTTTTSFTTSSEGLYSISASAFPKSGQDINPKDNSDYCSIKVTVQANPSRSDTDSGLSVGLSG